MLSWGPNIKIYIFKVETLQAALSTKWKFRWHDCSEAPSATTKEPNGLTPIAAGGEGIGRRTPAVVINNTITIVSCD